jgi:autophagy-related protein 2
MSWFNWQGRLLPYAIRYGLLKSGFLDDETAKDLANFDISLGSKRSVIELKNLGLNVQRISELAQLPPSLQLKTARVISLRLIFVREGYQPDVELEIDGIEIVVSSIDQDGESVLAAGQMSSGSARSQRHHTPDRRPRSPLPNDPGGKIPMDTDVHMPTTQEMARSFLKDETLLQRKELETSIVADMKEIDESFLSDAGYEDNDVGTGVAGGLPTFLSKILEGVLERIKYRVVDLQVRLETEVGTDAFDRCPVALKLHVREVSGNGVLGANVTVNDITLSLIAKDTFMAGMSTISRQTSPTLSRAPTQISVDEGSRSRTFGATASRLGESQSMQSEISESSATPSAHVANISHTSHEESQLDGSLDPFSATIEDSIEIQPGEDNESWRSRRTRADDAADDLWSSMLHEDDTPFSPLQDQDRDHDFGNPSVLPHRWIEAGDRPEGHISARVSTNTQSWPRLEGHERKPRSQTGLRSWPNFDDSNNVRHSLTEGDVRQVHQEVSQEAQPILQQDLRRSPSPEAEADSRENQAGEESDDQDNNEMLESRYYTHEEAESIYLSAIMETAAADIPGAWHVEDEISAEPLSTEVPKPTSSVPEVKPRELTESIASESTPIVSATATPRATSPSIAPVPIEVETITHESSFELLAIDKVQIVFERLQGPTVPSADAGLTSDQSKRKLKVQPSEMPGAFSVYSDMSRSRQSLANSIYSVPEKPSIGTSSPISGEHTSSALKIDIGAVQLRADVPSSRILYNLGAKVAAGLSVKQKETKPQPPALDSTTQSTSSITIEVGLEYLELSFHDRLKPRSQRWREHSTVDPITKLICTQVRFTANDDMSLRMKTFKILLGNTNLVSFQNDFSPMTASRKLPAEDFILDLVVSEHRTGVNNRPVTRIDLETAMLVLHVDLATIDEVFDSFGGLSGVLELGGSILGDSMSSTPTVKPASTKGVRFAGEADVINDKAHEIKFNGRVNGIDATLQTLRCSLILHTTALKVIHRHYATSVAISQIVLKGPFDESPSESPAESPVCLDVSGLRLEYQNSPQDKDLERLLSLLTPSKDKYDNDNDILIDTLLRQRRKGAVLKVIINDTKFKLTSWTCIPVLATLGEDLSRLSAVTKYLPEDERPGMLALVYLKTTEAQLPVNEQFGTLRVTLQDTQLAHVGLPALLALAIGKIHVSQVGGPDLIHPLAPYQSFENLPVLMARLLGDEEEPTFKIKLFNLAIEYSVPVLKDLLGPEQLSEPEQVILNMVESIASLSMINTPRQPVVRSTSEASATNQKRMRLDLQIHDTAIGLAPHKMTSKVQFVLNDAHVSTVVPPGDIFKISVELKKATLYITDIATAPSPDATLGKSPPAPQSVDSLYSAQGYVSIGSIMRATIIVHMAENRLDPEQKNVEVDVKTELFLLETCADSTATLFATLGDLAPPSAPSKDAKYLTQPITIEDMMASFTGEPVSESIAMPETLFDVDDDINTHSDIMFDVAELDVESQHLFEESEMSSSLYGPIGDSFDEQYEEHDLADNASVAHDDLDTVASLLEDDPFEMPDIPEDVMGDAHLLRELDKQRLACEDDKPVSLLPEKAAIKSLGGTSIQDSKNPLKLRIRDTHLIWQLYDGYDWQRTRNDIEHTVEQVELKAAERKARRRESRNDVEDDESVIGDFLFNSIYIGIGAGHETQDLRRAINKAINDQATETESVAVSGTSRPTSYSASGQPRLAPRRSRLKLGRSKKNKIAFELRNVAADVKTFAPGSGEDVMTASLRIGDFEIFDRVPTSTWRKFLTHIDNSPRTREISRPMFDIDIRSVKTLQSHSASEMLLHVSVLPIRLHVDQDALDFINRFFEFKDPTLVSTDPPSEEPFIQRLEVDTVDLRLDYKPKQLDYVGLRAGRTSELKNIVTLEGADIQLKHLIVYGLRGFDKVHPTLNDIWVEDVIRNQLPTVLSGIAAMRSLVTIGTGIRDVVAIPVREYRKDGRIVRSIQKGGYKFGKTTASELARLGAKVALGTQTVLTTAEQFLSPTSSSRPGTNRRVSSDSGLRDIASDDDESEQRLVSAYANQPLGLLSGLQTARRQLEHDLLTAKDALIAVQGEVMDSRGPGDAIAAVARHAPTLLLRPVIGATRAVGTTLLGVGNQIDRSNMRSVEDVSPPTDEVVLRSLLTCVCRNTSLIDCCENWSGVAAQLLVFRFECLCNGVVNICLCFWRFLGCSMSVVRISL